MNFLRILVMFASAFAFISLFSLLVYFFDFYLPPREGERKNTRSRRDISAQNLSAAVICLGPSVSPRIHRYEGLDDCRVASIPYGGDRACRFSCLGYGTCVAICPLGALMKGNDGSIIVSTDCDGCGLCAKECPTGSIRILPRSEIPLVRCERRPSGESASICSNVNAVSFSSFSMTKNAFQQADNELELTQRDHETVERE